jgi:hypothetical protein
MAATAEPIYNPSARMPPRKYALTDAATITTNATLGDIFTVTFGGNRTMALPTGMVDGQKIEFWITNNGSRTVTWASGYAATADIALPSLTSGSTATDMFLFVWNATDSKLYITAVNKGAA